MQKKTILWLVAIIAVTVLVAVWAGIPESIQNNPTKFKADNGQQTTTVASVTADTGYMITRAVITNDDSTQLLIVQPAGTAAYVSATAGGNTGFPVKPGETLAFDCNVRHISFDSDGTCDYRYFFSEQVQ